MRARAACHILSPLFAPQPLCFQTSSSLLVHQWRLVCTLRPAGHLNRNWFLGEVRTTRDKLNNWAPFLTPGLNVFHYLDKSLVDVCENPQWNLPLWTATPPARLSSLLWKAKQESVTKLFYKTVTGFHSQSTTAYVSASIYDFSHKTLFCSCVISSNNICSSIY